MKRSTRMALATALAMLASKASAASLTLDNFDEYTAGQAIATSASSTPWLRFGSIGDNLYASNTSTYLLDGAFSGEIPIAITSLTGSATIQKNFVTGMNLSSYLTSTVLSKSVPASGSSFLGIQLSITDGTTTYLSTAVQDDSTTAKTYTFSLASGAFTLAAGSLPFSTVLASATSVGFRVSDDGTSATVNEHFVVDDFAVQTNPTSVWTPAGSAIGMLQLTGTPESFPPVSAMKPTSLRRSLLPKLFTQTRRSHWARSVSTARTNTI